MILAVAAIAALALLLGGGVGFALGGATADTPKACLDAVSLADAGFALAADDLVGIEEGLNAVLDGELPEAYGVLAEVRLRMAEMWALRAEYRVAAAACRRG